MKCPAQDGELIHHTAQGKNNLTVSYSTCPECRGYFMDSFAANYIKTGKSSAGAASPRRQAYHCPVCDTLLIRSTGENIPDDVFVYDCPLQHGYFFPEGQLAAFKKAQQVKIAYHKLWHIATPNITSILLASIMLLFLTGGFAITYSKLQQNQNTVLKAKEILIGHGAYISSDRTTVLISGTTSSKTALTVHIPTWNNFSAPLETTNGITHLYTITRIPPGTYRYFFTMIISGMKVQSDTFTFTVRP